MDEHDQIERWRRRIDEVDRAIVELLNERSRCALAIGAVKRLMGRAVYDPDREETIVRQAVEANAGPMGDDAVRRLFERILDESRRTERLAAEAAVDAAAGETDPE
ncbi:MAG TPA: chorismate mutase [Candidatus Polarisedimenticolia bacterium]|nr:chorismate mutase [Candidatus Polarisedimenticolia bacterium]